MTMSFVERSTPRPLQATVGEIAQRAEGVQEGLCFRPRLAQGVRYARIPRGMLVRGLHGECVVAGAAAYDVLDRLTPHLTGEYTLEELTAALTPERRSAVVQLVKALEERALLTDARADEPHQLPESVRAEYADEISFIAHGYGSAERRFERLRDGRITLMGGGPVLSAVLRAGLWSGWRRVQVVTTDHTLEETILLCRRDPGQHVALTVAAEPPDKVFTEADLVLHVAYTTDEARRVTRRARRLDAMLGQLLVTPAAAWVAPIGANTEWPDLPENGSADGTGHNWLTGAVPDVVAAQLCLTAFRHLTGMAESAAADSALVRVDLRTLETSRHSVTVSAAAPSTINALLARGAEVTDPYTGILASLGLAELPQTPLCLVHARLRGRAEPILGWGPSQETATARALLTAAAIHSYETEEQPHDTAHVEAVDVLTGEVVRLAAQALAPHAQEPAVGVAAGLSWSDAVLAGVRNQADALVARVCVDRWESLPVLDLPDDDVVASHGVQSAAAPELRDASAVLGYPAAATRTPAAPPFAACAATLTAAVRSALELSSAAAAAGGLRSSPLPSIEATHNTSTPGITAAAEAVAASGDGRGAITPAASDGPASAVSLPMPEGQINYVAAALKGADDRSREVRVLAARMQDRAGRRAYAVPLARTPALTPYVVRVVLVS